MQLFLVMWKASETFSCMQLALYNHIVKSRTVSVTSGCDDKDDSLVKNMTGNITARITLHTASGE